MPVFAIIVKKPADPPSLWTETEGPTNWTADDGTWNAGESRYDPKSEDGYFIKLDPLSGVKGWYPEKIRLSITRLTSGSDSGIIETLKLWGSPLDETDFALTSAHDVSVQYEFDLDWTGETGDIGWLELSSPTGSPGAQEFTLDSIEFYNQTNKDDRTDEQYWNVDTGIFDNGEWDSEEYYGGQEVYLYTDSTSVPITWQEGYRPTHMVVTWDQTSSDKIGILLTAEPDGGPGDVIAGTADRSGLPEYDQYDSGERLVCSFGGATSADDIYVFWVAADGFAFTIQSIEFYREE